MNEVKCLLPPPTLLTPSFPGLCTLRLGLQLGDGGGGEDNRSGVKGFTASFLVLRCLWPVVQE